MKHNIKIFSLLLIAIAALHSCSGNYDPDSKGETTSGKITINCNAIIPGSNVSLETKSLGETPSIKSLYLVIFDSNGSLLEIDKAVPGTYNVPEDTFTPDGNSENETVFHVEVTPSTEPRIIHFVANYVADKANYGAEYDVMNKMYTSGTDDAYWQRVEVPSLSTSTVFERVPLIRNFLKISLEIAADVESTFTVTGYFLYNMNNSGSVAPFNINTGIGDSNRFASYLNSNGEMHTYSEMLEQNYTGCEPGNVAISNPDLSSITFLSKDTPSYVYENTYKPNSPNYPFVIIRGHLTGKEDTYYKADFSYTKDNETIHYNLLRNFNYKIIITKVNDDGYETLNSAINGLPLNDLLGATTSADINNISADNQHLYVNFTDEMAVNTDPIELKYKNVVDVSNSNAVNNAFNTGGSTNQPITISGLDGGEVVNSYSIATSDDASYYRTITIIPKTPIAGRILRQTVTITNAAGLARTVTLTLRTPLTMTLSCTPATVSSLGTDIDLKLTIPAGLIRYRFPMEFYIESDKNNVYPNSTVSTYAEMPVVTGTSIINSSVHSYSFRRTLTFDEYEAATNNNGYKTFDCHFLLYKSTAGITTLYVKPNKYFNGTIQTSTFNVAI